MKNLFFSLAFLLVGTVAFASNNESNDVQKNITLIKITPPMGGSGTATDSCGNEWEVTWSCGRCSVLDLIIAIDDAIGDETGGELIYRIHFELILQKTQFGSFVLKLNFMKNIFLLMLLIFTTFAIAQKNTSEILYDFKHQTDTLNKNIVKNEKFRLIFNQDLSLYKSIKQEVYDSLYPIIGKQKEIEFNKTGNIDMKGMPSKGTANQYYTDLSKAQTLMKVKFNKLDYLVVEQDIISWEIQVDSKIILDKKCQQATAYFKGRNYIAWFTSEIPASVGPWKLNGLPGAILEIKDNKDEVSFIAYQYLKSSNTAISLPKDVEKISKKEFEAVEKALKDNPALSNSGIQLTKIGGGKNVTKRINNPVELKE